MGQTIQHSHPEIWSRLKPFISIHDDNVRKRQTSRKARFAEVRTRDHRARQQYDWWCPGRPWVLECGRGGAAMF